AFSPTSSGWCAKPSRRARAPCTTTWSPTPAASTCSSPTPAAGCAEARVAGGFPLPPLAREGVVALAQLDADGHARQVEGVAQAVGQVAQVGGGQGLGPGAEGDEGRRPGSRLRHEADLHPAPLGGWRRVALQCLAQPAVG